MQDEEPNEVHQHSPLSWWGNRSVPITFIGPVCAIHHQHRCQPALQQIDSCCYLLQFARFIIYWREENIPITNPVTFRWAFFSQSTLPSLSRQRRSHQGKGIYIMASVAAVVSTSQNPTMLFSLMGWNWSFEALIYLYSGNFLHIARYKKKKHKHFTLLYYNEM